MTRPHTNRGHAPNFRSGNAKTNYPRDQANDASDVDSNDPEDSAASPPLTALPGSDWTGPTPLGMTFAGALSARSYAGIYAASMDLTDGLNSQLPLKIYKSSAVTGVALNMNWATLETAPGVYDWAPLDYAIQEALKYGKQISLAIEPNHYSAPSWLFQEGVPDLNFTVLNHGGLNTIDIAPPWNPTYQQAYAQMMMALSNHLQSIPGAYQAVSVVKITGMAEVSSEIRLPNASDTTGGVTNTIPIWQAQGYTPAQVLAAWNGFAASVNAAFPDKMLAEETILDPTAFPTINNQGQFVSVTDPSFVNVVQGIISEGLAQYGGRFAVQWDALNNADMPATELAAEQLGATGFWEANKYLPGGSGNGSNWQVQIPLTAADYQQMLDSASIRAPASFSSFGRRIS
jgi:hypothetical protein